MHFFLTLLNLDTFSFENSLDPDKLESTKQTDQDQCFSYRLITGILQGKRIKKRRGVVHKNIQHDNG